MISLRTKLEIELTPQTQLQAFTKGREKQPKPGKHTYKPTLQKHISK
jgi:hypothetical protein